MKRNMNSGYVGYSMSVRAEEAYECGEMPLSKWSKRGILAAVEELRPEMVKALARLNLRELHLYALQYTSWHHTSKHPNRTDFYAINEDFVMEVTLERIEEIVDQREKKETTPPPERKLGDIYYLEWGGTKKHPKPINRVLKSVWIEEHGSQYFVYDSQGKLIKRKSMYSNGTWVKYKD